MTKTVLTNAMVAHVWAQQTQPHGRSSNGNSSFDGPSLYSYSAEIARFVPTPDGRSLPLFTDRSWSITTSAHQGRAHSAVNYAGYTVPSYTDHAANLAFLVAAYDDEKVKLPRIRDLDSHDWILRRFAEQATYVLDYACDFGLAAPPINPTVDTAAIRTAHAARAATQVAINADRITAWRSGLGSDLRFYDHYRMPTMLRVCGHTIETSRGARLPAAHGKRAFPLIAGVRASDQPWQPNGHAIHLGPFTIDRIDPDGTVHAGCHTVPWSEIAACAAALGLRVAPEPQP